MRWEKLHSDTFIIDGHCDTILNYDRNNNYDILNENQGVQLDVPKMELGGLDLQFFAIFIEDDYLPNSGFTKAVQLIEKFRYNIGKCEKLELIYSKVDLQKAQNSRRRRKKYGLLTAEGGEIIEGKIELLNALFRLGVRGMTLTWNSRNQIADGIEVGKNAGGLTERGCQVVNKMNKLGMLIDVSHLSFNSFEHLMEINTAPIVATHSNAYSVCQHPRNLTDYQLKKIAETEGVIGVNFSSAFLSDSKGPSKLEHISSHIDYIIKLIGEDYIALGTDYDGITDPPYKMETIADLPKLTEFLWHNGFTDTQISKILGENWTRVLKKVLK